MRVFWHCGGYETEPSVALQDFFATRGRLVILDSRGSRTAVAEACRRVFDRISTEAFFGVAVRVAGSAGRVALLTGLITLPTRIVAAERAILRVGRTRLEGRYGVYPGIEAPTLVYELGGPAADYSTSHLIPSRRAGVSAALLWAIARWIGCDPSLGAILVIGRKCDSRD